MDVRGQGALEYLLLIGGAVLVAAIVIALISGMPAGTDAQARTYCGSRLSFANCLSANVANDGGGAAGSLCCAVQNDATVAADQTEFAQCAYYSSGTCPS